MEIQMLQGFTKGDVGHTESSLDLSHAARQTHMVCAMECYTSFNFKTNVKH